MRYSVAVFIKGFICGLVLSVMTVSSGAHSVELADGGIVGGVQVNPVDRALTTHHDSLTRIVGGVESESPYSWMVSIQEDRFSHFCGGTLISPSWVLTAAHCMEDIEASTLRLYIGGLSSDRQDIENVGEMRTADYVFIHPLYDADTVDNDIALIKLSSSSSKTPVSLADVSVGTNLPSGVDLKAIGWGKISESAAREELLLREVLVSYQTDAVCRQTYGLGLDYWDTYLCAGETSGGKDACQGDSGGPLVVNVNDEPALIGVVSWGRGCGDAGSFGVYSDVTAHEEWINDVRERVMVQGPDKIGFLGVHDNGFDRKKTESYFISNFGSAAVSVSAKSIVDTPSGSSLSPNFEISAESWHLDTVPANSICEFHVNALGASQGEHDAVMKLEITDSQSQSLEIQKLLNSKVLAKDVNAATALDSNWVWFNGHDESWQVVSGEGVGGSHLVSGDIGDNQRSILLSYVNGPGYLVFDSKYSTENGADGLIVAINELTDSTFSGKEAQWRTYRSDELGEGVQHIMFIFEKDSKDVLPTGDDAVWLDNVRLCTELGNDSSCRSVLSDYAESSTATALQNGSVCQDLSPHNESVTYRTGTVTNFAALDDGDSTPVPDEPTTTPILESSGSGKDKSPFGIGAMMWILLILPILVRAKKMAQRDQTI